MPKNADQVAWVPLLGSVAEEAGALIYTPRRFPEGPSAGQLVTGMIRASEWFSEGRVGFSLHTGDAKAMCILQLADTSGRPVYVGVNSWWGGLYSIVISEGPAMRPVVTMGDAGTLPTGLAVNLEVRVRGSRLELLRDGVITCSANVNLGRGQLAFWLSSEESFTVDSIKISPSRPQAFVVMQYTDEYNELFREVIKPSCEKFGFDVVRADEIASNGMILWDVLDSIHQATIVIADITPDNPNVFYEVGYSHGVGKQVILMSEKRREKLPFDVSGLRTLFYDNTIGGKSHIEQRLDAHLEAIVSQVSNP